MEKTQTPSDECLVSKFRRGDKNAFIILLQRHTLYIKKGDYWAFRELSLSYALQTKWLKAAKIETLDITAAMYNLGYLTAYDGLTPEVIGADAGKYSRPRQFLCRAFAHARRRQAQKTGVRHFQTEKDVTLRKGLDLFCRIEEFFHLVRGVEFG